MATAEMWRYRDDIRSDVDLSGYEVEARDGSIGTVDEGTSGVDSSYIVVDTGPWIFGKHVLLPAGVIDRVDTNNRRIVVSRTRDEIKNAPEYDPQDALTSRYRQEVGSYYGGLQPIGEEASRTSFGSQSQSRSPRSRSSTSARTRSSTARRRSTSTKASRSPSRASRARTRSQGDGPTKEELYEQAKRLNIEGRSKMNKAQLARAVGRKRGGSTKSSTSQRSRSTSKRSRTRASATRRKANPVEVQAFLDGVSYPTRKGDLLREAERSGARRDVRTTLERLPEERFDSPTDVSEAIGRLRR